MSGNHGTATAQDELRIVARRQDAFCVFFIGKTLNGEGPMEIVPTPDSWCGRMNRKMDSLTVLTQGLEKRMLIGTATIVGALYVLNKVAPLIWKALS